jgi:hypothetical protein
MYTSVDFTSQIVGWRASKPQVHPRSFHEGDLILTYDEVLDNLGKSSVEIMDSVYYLRF